MASNTLDTRRNMKEATMNAKITRRHFLGVSAAAAGSLAAGGAALISPARGSAEPFGLPLGLQLYSVRDQLKQDFDGTLSEIGKLGYREVEAAGFYGKTASQVTSAMTSAGLRCVSSHSPYGDLGPRFGEILDYVRRVGVEYLICSSPGHKTPGATGKLTIDDWRWNASEFNRMGKACADAGIRFGYHNHVAEFGVIDGMVPYDELLRLTDPAKVTMEMDCGWVIVGGGDPVALMRKHPGRISMLHVKDFTSVAPGEAEHPAAELGHGVIDYKPIFAEAKKSQQIKHVFIEQEQFDKSYQVSLKMDADYLRKFS